MLSGLAHNACHGLRPPFLRGQGVPVERVGLFFAAVTATGEVRQVSIASSRERRPGCTAERDPGG
ncbi:MAG: hypothetical protein RDU89_02505 [bacterium]|nr:hypothetical protein [bacterium]